MSRESAPNQYHRKPIVLVLAGAALAAQFINGGHTEAEPNISVRCPAVVQEYAPQPAPAPEHASDSKVVPASSSAQRSEQIQALAASALTVIGQECMIPDARESYSVQPNDKDPNSLDISMEITLPESKIPGEVKTYYDLFVHVNRASLGDPVSPEAIDFISMNEGGLDAKQKPEPITHVSAFRLDNGDWRLDDREAFRDDYGRTLDGDTPSQKTDAYMSVITDDVHKILDDSLNEIAIPLMYAPDDPAITISKL